MNILKKLFAKSEPKKKRTVEEADAERRSKAIFVGKMAIAMDLPEFKIIATSGGTAIVQKGKIVRCIGQNPESTESMNADLPYEWPEGVPLTGNTLFDVAYLHKRRKRMYNVKDVDCQIQDNWNFDVEFLPYTED